jgi:hypothetical protein
MGIYGDTKTAKDRLPKGILSKALDKFKSKHAKHEAKESKATDKKESAALSRKGILKSIKENA